MLKKLVWPMPNTNCIASTIAAKEIAVPMLAFKTLKAQLNTSQDTSKEAIKIISSIGI